MSIIMTNINAETAEGKKDIYRLTHTKSAVSLTEMKNRDISVKQYAVSEVENADGEIKRVVYIANADGIYASSSSSFLREFMEMVEIFGTDLHTVRVCTGRSRSNREYITAEYVD